MQTIAQTLSRLACGTPQRFRNVTLWPLLSGNDVQPSYLTLDEALERSVVRITEVSDEGSAPSCGSETRPTSPSSWWTARRSSAPSRTGFSI